MLRLPRQHNRLCVSVSRPNLPSATGLGGVPKVTRPNPSQVGGKSDFGLQDFDDKVLVPGPSSGGSADFGLQRGWFRLPGEASTLYNYIYISLGKSQL